MICPRCKAETSHIKILPGRGTLCHGCGGFAQTGGARIDKILTRNSDRVRDQQHQHEGDMITPYVWDNSQQKLIVNDDFVELYPNQSAQTFKEDELKESGHGNLLDEISKKSESNDVEAGDVEFVGNENDALRQAIAPKGI